jgi:hypothetical protein
MRLLDGFLAMATWGQQCPFYNANWTTDMKTIYSDKIIYGSRVLKFILRGTPYGRLNSINLGGGQPLKSTFRNCFIIFIIAFPETYLPENRLAPFIMSNGDINVKNKFSKRDPGS